MNGSKLLTQHMCLCTHVLCAARQTSLPAHTHSTPPTPLHSTALHSIPMEAGAASAGAAVNSSTSKPNKNKGTKRIQDGM